MTAALRDVRAGIDDYQAWATDPTPRIGMGLSFFDNPTRGGIAKAECAMVLAYSSVGKTSLALNFIVNNPRIPTLFFSLEMSWRLVVARLAAIDTGTPTWELEKVLRDGHAPQQLIDTGAKYPVLYGNDASEMSLKEMKTNVHEASVKMGQPVRLIVIDYLELIGGQGMLGKGEQVDRAAQKIRALAKDTDSSVVVLHQVAKTDGSGGHEPLQLDSGKFGGHHPMDYVIGAYAPRLDRKLDERARQNVEEEIYLQLLKNRSGKAVPNGIRHRLSVTTGRLTEWNQPIFNTHTYSPGYQPTFDVGLRPEPELEN